MTNTDNLIENVAKEISIEYKQFAKHRIVNKKSKVETDKHSYNGILETSYKIKLYLVKFTKF